MAATSMRTMIAYTKHLYARAVANGLLLLNLYVLLVFFSHSLRKYWFDMSGMQQQSGEAHDRFSCNSRYTHMLHEQCTIVIPYLLDVVPPQIWPTRALQWCGVRFIDMGRHAGSLPNEHVDVFWHKQLVQAQHQQRIHRCHVLVDKRWLYNGIMVIRIGCCDSNTVVVAVAMVEEKMVAKMIRVKRITISVVDLALVQ